MSERKNNIKKYFAAANSYNGFVSYFDKIFPSNKFSRVYVLKGGPGTGKSSLMRRFSSALAERNCKIDEIYCSSDPNSLDGLIAETEKGRVAFIDGTAPHERDAVVPGAVDEIINLGDNWEKNWLVANRSLIENITKEKSSSYKTAYKYLKIAGVSNDLPKEIYNEKTDNIGIKNEAEKLLSGFLSEDNANLSVKLISSFGRMGHYNLDPFEGEENEIIGLKGTELSNSFFLKVCKEILLSKNIRTTVYPSALDPEIIDALEIDNLNVVIKADEKGQIDTEEFITISELDKERIKKADYLRDEALIEAQRWFKTASEFHFRLEEIYGQAMNYEKNDIIFEEKMKEIDNLL